MNEGYKLVRLSNGEHSIHSFAFGETMHPGVGPAREAEALYVNQLKLSQRLQNHCGEFVVWDIGTGGGANVLTFLRSTKSIKATVRIVGFENTLEPLRFALNNADQLGYFSGHEDAAARLCSDPHATAVFQNGLQSVSWQMVLSDFPSLLKRHAAELPAPHVIFFDPFSPRKNPEMWTAQLFVDLFRCLMPERPCSLATYSRSTMVRVALLLAGFFVGAGQATGQKEETTIAANTLALVEVPLGKNWLDRALRSDSAEPLWEPVYTRAKLSQATFSRLKAHPQFA